MIKKALRAADEQQEEVVRAVFRAAGLLWQCKGRDCRFDNTAAQELCERCGRQRNGRRVTDQVPPSAHPDDFENLRAELKEYFAHVGRDLPDAVTFQLDFHKRWRTDDATLHFGSRAEVYDFEDPDVDLALSDLGRADDRGETLRVALYR
ncbi:hypothetical protein [Streptomyces mutabilis]|uniref:RanBP2-type domain-containing protein n=1 Tax=Streptomyces mutabilis TaxID=67332 RepID=A0A086MRB7_9ACTN|nr:hypothetical protein [Streptomyces mutabilis]KFG71435.1 hypothetical protein FM21_34735 [Streptomyces mutabilis]